MKHGGLLPTALKNYVVQHTEIPQKWFAANLFRGFSEVFSISATPFCVNTGKTDYFLCFIIFYFIHCFSFR